MRPPQVLPITPGDCRPEGVQGLREQICRLKEGGGDGLLLREPFLSDALLLELAASAREIFTDGWLGIHDRVHVALACGADAVQLGFRSLAPEVAREIAGTELSIGHSQHHAELTIGEMHADYRLMGPAHATPSKEGVLEPLGIQQMRGLSMPERTWAVGGIGPDQVPELLSLGLGGVACIRGVFGVGDPAQGIAEMLEAAQA